ncbi:MAG TPA: phosphatase PAP2 family protein [Streptosporangiaceae bacterium]
MIIFNPTWEEAAAAAASVGAVSAALLYRGKALAVTVSESGDPRQPGETASHQDQDARTARTARRMVASGRFAREAALVVGLFALWQFAGSFSVMGPDGALGRAQWLWDAERAMRLPSEAWLQRLVLPHPLLMQVFNLYYDILHFPVLIACLIWLFIWHRDRYGPFRITLAVFTGLCLLIQLIPVAPPRMLTGIGMVDSAALYGQSVYSSAGGFEADQLSAMPSVHVGWAILVAIAVITVVRSRWRWLALLYPVLTTIAVVVTANHFWLDGVAAGIVLAAVLAVQAAVRRVLPGRAAPGAGREPVSQPAGVMTRSGGG